MGRPLVVLGLLASLPAVDAMSDPWTPAGNGKSFKVVDIIKSEFSQLSCEEYCAAEGGGLATITSKSENTAANTALRTVALGYPVAYIGLYQEKPIGQGLKEGWVWIESTATSSYRNWMSGEPGDYCGTNEACAGMMDKKGQWADLHCTYEDNEWPKSDPNVHTYCVCQKPRAAARASWAGEQTKREQACHDDRPSEFACHADVWDCAAVYEGSSGQVAVSIATILFTVASVAMCKMAPNKFTRAAFCVSGTNKEPAKQWCCCGCDMNAAVTTVGVLHILGAIVGSVFNIPTFFRNGRLLVAHAAVVQIAQALVFVGGILCTSSSCAGGNVTLNDKAKGVRRARTLIAFGQMLYLLVGWLQAGYQSSLHGTYFAPTSEEIASGVDFAVAVSWIIAVIQWLIIIWWTWYATWALYNFEQLCLKGLDPRTSTVTPGRIAMTGQTVVVTQMGHAQIIPTTNAPIMQAGTATLISGPPGGVHGGGMVYAGEATLMPTAEAAGPPVQGQATLMVAEPALPTAMGYGQPESG